MATTEVPTRDDLVRRVTELVPLLRRNTVWSEENRRMHTESMEALSDAGLFRLRVPKRYGGYEVDARTLVEVGAELGRADGSTAWTAAVYAIPTWMACMYPDEVQDEVFSRPNVLVCGTLSPTATATPASGGVVVDGRWGFITGAHHSHWQVVIAVLAGPDGAAQPIMALAPMADLKIVDDWHAAGLRGTGSVSTVAENVFIPQERILPLEAVLKQQYASELNADSPVFRAPLLPTSASSSVGPVLGMAKAAREAFFERLPHRKISYTDYATQSEAPLTHHQVADAVMKIDEAEFHAYRLAALVDAKGAEGTAWTVEERARSRADLGAVCRLAKDAVDVFATASGASALYSHMAMQRISRDVQAVNLHALMHPDTNAELYGRVLCGLPPNSLYI